MERKTQFNTYGKVRRGRRLRRAPAPYTTRGGTRNPISSTGKNAVKDPMDVSDLPGLAIRNLPLFPRRTQRCLSYYSAGSVITGTATANAYIFSANGIFDPDISGTGGQPMGFDQMMVFYNHYTVIRSRLRVVWTNSSTTLPVSVAVVKSGDTTILSSIEQLMENGDLSFCVLGYNGQKGSSLRLSNSCDVALFQGIDNIMDDPDMRGDAASNPTEQSYFHLATWNPVSATQITSTFQVIIEYDVVFHEPRKGSLS